MAEPKVVHEYDDPPLRRRIFSDGTQQVGDLAYIDTDPNWSPRTGNAKSSHYQIARLAAELAECRAERDGLREVLRTVELGLYASVEGGRAERDRLRAFVCRAARSGEWVGGFELQLGAESLLDDLYMWSDLAPSSRAALEGADE